MVNRPQRRQHGAVNGVDHVLHSRREREAHAVPIRIGEVNLRADLVRRLGGEDAATLLAGDDRQRDVHLRVEKRKLPAIAEVAELVGLQGVVDALDGDWDAGERDAKVGVLQVEVADLGVADDVERDVALGGVAARVNGRDANRVLVVLQQRRVEV